MLVIRKQIACGASGFVLALNKLVLTGMALQLCGGPDGVMPMLGVVPSGKFLPQVARGR